MTSNPFFKIEFSEDEQGKIHVDTWLTQKDKDGYFLTSNQRGGFMVLIDGVIKSIQNNDLESLK